MRHIKNILFMIVSEFGRNGVQKTKKGWDTVRDPHIQPKNTSSQIAVYAEILRWAIKREREEAQKGKAVVKAMIKRQAANTIKERGFRWGIEEEYDVRNIQWSPNNTNNRINSFILKYPERFKRFGNG